MITTKYKPVLFAGVAAFALIAFSSCDSKNVGPHHKKPNEMKSEPHGKQHSEEMHKKYNFKSEPYGKQHSEEAHQKQDFKSEPQGKQYSPSARAPQAQQSNFRQPSAAQKQGY